jgi:plastocyanin
MRKLAAAMGLAAVALVAVACAEEPLDEVEVARGIDTVAVDDNRFGPRVVEVPVGTEVTWRFEDSKQHDVKGDGFGSPVQQEGAYAFTFGTPGAYDYRCSLHGNMTGRVLVVEEATAGWAGSRWWSE